MLLLVGLLHQNKIQEEVIMEHLIHGLFQNDLLRDEKILWTGQPDPKAIFTRIDFFLVPFSVLWLGLFISFDFFAFGNAISNLFGLFFMFFGSYFVFGRFLYKIWKKSHTYYCVTDRRVLILTTLLHRNLRAVFIDTLPTIGKSIRPDGKGTITFGNRTFLSSWYANTGMELLDWSQKEDVPTFYDIAEADRVYRIVNELRYKKEPEEF